MLTILPAKGVVIRGGRGKAEPIEQKSIQKCDNVLAKCRNHIIVPQEY